MTKKKTLYRQGDVLIMPAPKKLNTSAHVEVPRERGSVVLAHGEVTGHRHRLDEPGVCLLSCEGISDRVLTVVSMSMLRHEEHDAIEIPAGTYVVRIQREYDELNQSRRVED